jgi:predicted unusual protein kinase regulating ubiquinone biosynthesis (AarF/ABC1/UbiB family)
MFIRRIGFSKYVRQTRPERLGKIARGYHDLAVEMGGVLIKVGQFLSARADILPEEITSELSGLQDEVPAEDFNSIKELAEIELGAPLSTKYIEFEEQPLAAASLGQVHRAKLPAAEEDNSQAYLDVVVKVQRPDIEIIIATDLSALRTVSGWLMRYKPIRLRADIPALLAEFSRILYEEIDYLAEGRNAEIFAENFKDVRGVRVPGVVWSHTTRRLLTLEDVYAIKITDYYQISHAGVSRQLVAKRLFDTYLRQIFEDGFFHADPHPGNLFVEPGADGEDQDDWQLTFVDFGMVGHVPANAKAGLREIAIGLATRDAERMVHAYQLLDMLLPGADLNLIAKADSVVFDRFWGKSMEELREISFEEMHEFADDFRELAYSMPFQVPQDIVFLLRTIAILSGMCTGLDPKFNFWESLIPYASKLIAEDGETSWDIFFKEATTLLGTLVALPKKLDTALEKIERDQLGVRMPGLESQFRRLESTLRQVVFALIFLGLLIGGVQLHLADEIPFSRVLFAGAVLVLVITIFSKPRNR